VGRERPLVYAERLKKVGLPFAKHSISSLPPHSLVLKTLRWPSRQGIGGFGDAGRVGGASHPAFSADGQRCRNSRREHMECGEID